MKRLVLVLVAAAALGLGWRPLAAQGKGLQIFFVDVEGGAATLIVTPMEESVLVDTGWPGFDDRDPKRIQRAAKLAGVSRIDHLVTTHWHRDHYGGVEGLAKLMPIGRFYDHGIPDSLSEDPDFPTMIAAYKKASGGQSTTLHPGDAIPLREGRSSQKISLTCLAAAGKVITDGKDAGRPNPECVKNQPKPPDPSDNARSIVLLLKYGDFRFLDCGDLTWNVEHELVCPTNKIGRVDLYQVTHHGLNQSSNPVLVRSIAPRCAVTNNGPRKGGDLETYATLKSTPSIEAIFQLHRNVATTDTDNAPPAFIANVNEQCEGKMVRCEVAPNGKRYTVSVEGKDTSRRFEVR